MGSSRRNDLDREMTEAASAAKNRVAFRQGAYSLIINYKNGQMMMMMMMMMTMMMMMMMAMMMMKMMKMRERWRNSSWKF